MLPQGWTRFSSASPPQPPFISSKFYRDLEIVSPVVTLHSSFGIKVGKGECSGPPISPSADSLVQESPSRAKSPLALTQRPLPFAVRSATNIRLPLSGSSSPWSSAALNANSVLCSDSCASGTALSFLHSGSFPREIFVFLSGLWNE